MHGQMTTIVEASNSQEIAAVRELLREYWNGLGLPESFQGFAVEMASLPGKYASPAGRLGLATLDMEPVGCVAFRQIDHYRCEGKRLYVHSPFRGQGIGRDLLKWAISEARMTGYREFVCDTLPTMKEALAMYEEIGFKRVGPYAPDPTPGAVYLSLALEPEDKHSDLVSER